LLHATSYVVMIVGMLMLHYCQTLIPIHMTP